MAELGLAVAQTLFAALQCTEIKEICSIWGYKSQLEDLSKTVSTVKNVLLDAESKLEFSNEARGYIEELKDAVYDADDLFNEFFTLLELKQLKEPLSKGREFSEKVRCFFSSHNQVSQAYKMCHEVKKIRKKLDAIVDNHKRFAFDVDYEPICRREETCSYVDVKDIIGRDDDKRVIIEKLLDSKYEDVRFLTIVGVGGLGKMALAQLVYNDEKLRDEFGDLRLWAYVSDQDRQQFDVRAILCKILESVCQKSFDAYALESVQKIFREQLGGKKYLLVLDDVWNENRDKWIDLQKLLMLGQGGSRIIVTTRSEMTTTIVGDGHTYRLEGLSPEHSWNLFEMTAFNKGLHQHVNHFEFVEIGNKIIERCYNIPLAIKVVGSLLYGQDIRKWRSFEQSGLAEIGKGDNKIMYVLKLSYHNLESSLKSCFSYCAVFPKDFEIEREKLISLWLAQGYIVPLDGGQNLEDAGEEHFFILLRRCFFQDVKKDEYDDVKSIKIHDLMHDVALAVGGVELSSVANKFVDKNHDVLYVSEKCPDNSFSRTKIRSYIRKYDKKKSCGYTSRQFEVFKGVGLAKYRF